MSEVNEFVALIKDFAPLMLVVVGLFIVLMLILLIAQKALVPVARETVTIFETFRASMKELLEEQNKLHTYQISKLESRIACLEGEMIEKNKLISTLQQELDLLRSEKKRDTKRITQLEAEVEQLKMELRASQAETAQAKSERDALQERLLELDKSAKPGDNVSIEQLQTALKNPKS